jgi:hypothetical protein
MDHVSIKYTILFHCKTLQNLPRFGFLDWKQTIWQPWFQIGRRLKFLGTVFPISWRKSFRSVFVQANQCSRTPRWPIRSVRIPIYIGIYVP